MADDNLQPAQPTLPPEAFGIGQQADQSISLLPRTTSELQSQRQQLEAGRQLIDTESPSEEMLSLGKQVGVPLESGIDTLDYMAYKLRQTPEEKVDWLNKRFGSENVRFNSRGGAVVRTVDPKTGMPKDRTVDPIEFGGQSLAGIAAEQGPAMLAAAATVRGGGPAAIAGKVGKLPLVGGVASKVLGGGTTGLGKAIIGAGAYEAVKAAQGAGVRAYDKPPIDMENIGYNLKTDVLQGLEGAAMVPIDVAMEMAPVKAGQGVNWMRDLLTGRPASGAVEAITRGTQKIAQKFAEPTEASKLGREGMEAWRKEGVQAKPTVGMVTDIPFLAKAWGYMYRHAAGAAAGEASLREWEESLRDMQKFMLSKGNLKSLEDIGSEGLLVLKQAYEQAEQGFAGETARTAEKILESSDKRVLDLFSIPKLPGMGYPWQETGAYLNRSASKTRDVWWEQINSLYDQFTSHPAAAQRVPPPAGFIAKMKELRASLPSTEARVGEEAEQAAQLMNLLGAAPEAVEREPLKEYVPSGVLGLIDNALKTEKGTTSILDLKAMRTEVNNAIKRSQAIYHVKDHYLGQVASAIDSGLQEAIDNTGDASLRQAFDTATGEYKAGIGKFRDKLLSRLWAHPEEVPVDNGALFNSIDNSQSRYKAFVDFFGKDSEAVKAFQQTKIKQLLSDSLAGGDAQTVNIPKLLTNAKSLANKNGDLFKDIFGKNAEKFQALESEQALRGVIPSGLDGDVDIKALEGLMQGNVPDSRQLRKLIQVENTRKKLYQNSVVKQFVQGKIGVNEIEPEEFVRALSEANIKDVDHVMSVFENGGKQKYIDDLRVKTLQTMFRKAERQATTRDRARSIMHDPTYLVSSEGLQKVMGSDEQQAVFRRILGPEQWNRLDNYLKVTLLEDQQWERARQAGFIASATSTAAAIKAGLNLPAIALGLAPSKKLTGELTDFAKYKLLSIMMAKPWGSQMLSQLGKPLPPPIMPQAGTQLSQRALANLVTSGEFLDLMAREFTDPLTRFQVMAWLKRATGQATEEPSAPMQTPEQFMQGMPQDNLERNQSVER